MKNEIKGDFVKNIRSKNIVITKKPILYYWWFKEEFIPVLLQHLDGMYDPKKIKFEVIHSRRYGLLYIGRAKNGHERLVKYHIYDSSNFHSKGVDNGRLSSLRQTLCGLLNINMSQAKTKINEIMDNNCYIEWEELPLEELNKGEKSIISSNYLPLNYQYTKNILTPEHRKKLVEIKKVVRQ